MAYVYLYGWHRPNVTVQINSVYLYGGHRARVAVHMNSVYLNGGHSTYGYSILMCWEHGWCIYVYQDKRCMCSKDAVENLCHVF